MVDSIVRAKVVEADVIVGVDPLGTNLSKDVFDTLELSTEDRESSTRTFRVEVSRESRNARDQDGHFETFLIFRGSDDALNQSGPDPV